MSSTRKTSRDLENNDKRKLIKDDEKTSTSKQSRVSSNANRLVDASKNKIEISQRSKPGSTPRELKNRSNVAAKNSISVTKSSDKPTKKLLSKDITAPIIKSNPSSSNANTAPKKKVIQTIPLHFIDKRSPRVNTNEQKSKETRVKQSGIYNQKNVTINSPKHKRKIISETANIDNHESGASSSRGIVVNDNKTFDISSNNHKRHRTRTLEPDEVKVMNKFSIKKTESENIIFPPESFYVPLNQTVVNHVPDKSPNDSDNNSYEDDFESYESDFDSYASSKDDKSNISSESSDKIEIESGIAVEAKAKFEEEKKFDSGNYELGDTSKQTESKSDNHLEKIKEIDKSDKNIKLTQYTSLTDEGFDENSAGLLSLNPNIESNANKKKTKHYERSNDLKNLITLDEVYYSLFEMIPMPYDTFIVNYGKSNRRQVSCQTGDDNVDAEAQTDVISTSNKWTQFPIDFSKHSIAEINSTKVKKPYLNYETNDKHVPISYLELYVNQTTGSGSDHLNKIDINPSLNKLDVLKLSRFMSSVGNFMLDYLNEHQDNNSNNISHDSSTDLSTVNNVMLQFIKKRPIRSIFSSEYSPNVFLTSHPCKEYENYPNKNETGNKMIICIWELNNKTLSPVKFLITADEVICCSINYGGINGVVVAGLENGNICAWDLTENAMWHEIVSEMITDSYIKIEKDAITLRKPSFHTSCDVSKLSSAKKYQWGSVVDITFVRLANNDSSMDYQCLNFISDQVYSLQEYGVLTIWTLIYMTRDLEKINKLSNYDFYDSYWSNLSLVKANVIDLKTYLGSELKFFSNTYKNVMQKNKITVKENADVGLSNITSIEHDKKGIIRAFSDEDNDFMGEILIKTETTPMLKKYSDDDYSFGVANWERSIICSSFKNIDYQKALLIVCNGSEIINYVQSGLRRKPLVFSCGDIGSDITDIEAFPSDLNYFLANCGSVIHLYSMCFRKPIKNFNYNHNNPQLYDQNQFLNSTKVTFEENLLNVFDFETSNAVGLKKSGLIQWPTCNPYTIVKVYDSKNIGIWDLVTSDISPKMLLDVYIDKNDHIVNMKLLYQKRNTAKCYMLLHMHSGKLKIYQINKKIFDCSKCTNSDSDLRLLKTYFKLL